MSNYNDFISAVKTYYNVDSTAEQVSISWRDMYNIFHQEGFTIQDYYKYMQERPDIFEIQNNINGARYNVNLKSSVNPNLTGNIGSSPNSNTTGSILGGSKKLNIPNIVNTSTTGRLEITGGIGLKADSGLTVSGVASTIGTAIGAVAIGAKLGKIIGDNLYESNPDIWDDGVISGFSQLDWGKFGVSLKDDISGRIQNGILGLFGVDGDNTTMYLDENAVGYLTWYLAQNGMLDNTITATYKPVNNNKYIGKFANGYTFSYTARNGVSGIGGFEKISGEDVYMSVFNDDGDFMSLAFSTKPFSYKIKGKDYLNGEDSTYNVNTKRVINGKSIYYNYSYDYPSNWNDYGGKYQILSDYIDGKPNNGNSLLYEPPTISNPSLGTFPYVYFTLYSADITETGKYDGISNNDNSTQFDPTGIGSVATALGALRNQFPEMWDNAITRKIPQDDGSENEHVFIPIPIPNFKNAFDKKPTTGTPNQKNPEINPDTAPKEDTDNIADTIAPPQTPSDNPNTGGGNTPNIVIPEQSASSLWAIYNPTLGQLNNLGAWLWSTNFIDQILKIFNDPMQAIIGLHKVYATPNISGSGNIKVGYLDSGVPSNIVGNQYTYIDCGTVSLHEYYGNILDYSPYTTVQLYLPFIGIVSLDVADVSRSSITVKYGVDVLTGACLASVSVQRDNAGGVLYQYSGNCACQYPLSSGSYMGMITGALGAIGSLARGNIIGTGLSVAGMHTNIERSGGFSGNAGAMGIKKPYLIISRPQSAMNNGFPSIQGYPSNYFTRLGDCSGFTQVAECHVENISATDKELDKIKDLLKEGVIL